MGAAVNETRVLERWALTTVAAIWTWLATNSDHGQQWWFAWLPVLVVSFFYFRTCALMNHTDGIAKYVRDVEREWPLRDPFGFERRYARSCNRTFKRATGHVFWIVLLVLTIAEPFVAPPNKALERPGREAKVDDRAVVDAGRSAPGR
jgi:hypothetical protein